MKSKFQLVAVDGETRNSGKEKKLPEIRSRTAYEQIDSRREQAIVILY